MGEEAEISDFDGVCGDEGPMMEWEVGLPSSDDLAPLSQMLIPPELASAFSVLPEPHRSMLDVSRASRNTMSCLRGQPQDLSSSNNFNLKSFNGDRAGDPLVVEEEEDRDLVTRDGSDSRKVRRVESEGLEEADSAMRTETFNDDSSAKTPKRSRLVWTAQLHKRFLDVVGHIGIENAVPKNIMQMMNVEGLTRENVASHLQKYRLYLKRKGYSNEGSSSSDHLVASTPVPNSSNESGGSDQGSGYPPPLPMPIPMRYPPQMVPMPMLGMAQGHGYMGMPVTNQGAPGFYHGYDSQHPYNFVQQGGDWSAHNYGSIGSYHHANPHNRD